MKVWHKDILCALTLIVISVALWAPRLRGDIDLRYDAGVYYILGTSLAEGNGYRLLSEPGNPEAVQYPPMLPAFVAVHQKVAGTSDPVVIAPMLRKSYMVMSILCAIAVFALARQFLAVGFAFLAALLYVLNKEVVFYSDLLFCELPFTFVTVLFFLVGAVAHRQAKCSRKGVLFVLATLLAWSAYLLRSAGIAVFVAWVGESLLKRQWKQAALRSAVCVVPVIAWQGYLSSVTHSQDYLQPAYSYQRAPYQFYNVTYARNVSLIDPFAPEKGNTTPMVIASRLAKNLKVIPDAIGQSVSCKIGYWVKLQNKFARKVLRVGPLPRELAYIPLVFLGLLTIVGGVCLARHQTIIVPLYIVGGIGLICLTPWPGQAIRYMVPLVPFLTICLVFLFANVVDWRRMDGQKWSKLATIAMGAAVFIGLIAQVYALRTTYRETWTKTVGTSHRLFHYEQPWTNFDLTINWLKGQIKPTDVIVTSAPHWVYLKLGNKAVMQPMEIDRKLELDLIDSAKPKWLIVDEFDFVDMTKTYAWPALQTDDGSRWKKVFEVAPPTEPADVKKWHERGYLTSVYERLP